MKRPIQLLFLLPFLIALLLAPASDLQSKPTPGQVGQSPSSSADLSAAFEGVGQKAVDLSAKAQSLQEQGDFQGAIIELERALRLDRGNRQLQKDLANAQQKLNERGEILRNLPADPKEREAELAKRYETATAAEAAGQRDKAREGYYEIWLANGTYRDVSAKLKSIDATPAVSAAPVAIASVAPEAPKPAAPAKPIDLKPLADSKLKPAEAVAAAPVAEIKAPEIKSRDLTALYKEASAKADKNDLDAARDIYEKILAQSPGDPKALAALKDLSSREMASVADKAKSEAKPLKDEKVKPGEAVEVALETEKTEKKAPVALANAPSEKLRVTAKDATIDKLPPLEAAPAPEVAATDDSAAETQRKADAMLQTGNTQDALKALAALKNLPAPKNEAKEVASATLDTPKAAAQPVRPAAPVSEKATAQITKLYDEGFAIYKKGDLKAAREKMSEILLIDETNERAKTFLSQTSEEWEARMADEKAVAAAATRDQAGKEKLNTAITIETRRPTPIGDFLNSLSFASGISFAIADGVQADVTAKFSDTPLQDVLNHVLVPNGLKWSISNGDIVVVTSDLRSRAFPLSDDTLSTLQAQMSSGQLQKMLWPPEGIPVLKGQELTLDERSKMLIATDSERNIERLTALLTQMRDAGPVGLEMSIYKVDPAKAPKAKALIEAILKTTSKQTPEDLERRIIIDGGDLLVYASPTDRAKIEDLLQNENFMDKIFERDLKPQVFSLIPREPLASNPELSQSFFRNVEEQLRIFLYSKTGQQQAAADGRKMWADPDTMQITVTDYPENLGAISEFISSLQEIEQKPSTKVIKIKNILADDLATQLRETFGLLSPAEFGPTGPVYIISKTLPVDRDYQWRDLTVRVRRVNENDLADERDDSVELLVRTGTLSDQITLEEFESEFVGDYEIVAEEISPSGVPGEGRANIQIRYIPPPGQAVLPPEAMAPQLAPTATDAADFDIDSFGDLNAIIVRYRNPSDLQEVERLIELLDKPVPQVDISTKMVEVNESRAKEMSAEWTINDLQELDFGLSDKILDTRFAQDADEFISSFEPGVETPESANLLKGATVIELVTGGPTSLNLQLRALEAEGIINVINGPRITIKNGEQGSLTITDLNTGQLNKFSWIIDSGDGGDGGGGNGFLNQDGGTGSGTDTGGGNNGGNIGNISGAAGQRIDMVLTPEVTSEQNIQVEVDAVFTDPVNNLASILGFERSMISTEYAFQNTGRNFIWGQTEREKDITTIAMVKSGGTIVLGGWLSERQQLLHSRVPVLGNIPYVGKLLFSRNRDTLERANMLIFLNVRLVPID